MACADYRAIRKQQTGFPKHPAIQPNFFRSPNVSVTLNRSAAFQLRRSSLRIRTEFDPWSEHPDKENQNRYRRQDPSQAPRDGPSPSVRTAPADGWKIIHLRKSECGRSPRKRGGKDDGPSGRIECPANTCNSKGGNEGDQRY